jgi:ATP-binding cassette subfamily B protein
MKEFKALLKFVKPYRWWVALATFSMVMVTSMNMASPWMIRNLIQTVTEGVSGEGSIARVNLLALAVIVIYILRAVSQFGTSYVSHYAAWKIEDTGGYKADFI